MICPNCRTENSSDSLFCRYCGQKLPQACYCTQCGAELTGEHRFCHRCGKALLPSPPAAEPAPRTPAAAPPPTEREDVRHRQAELQRLQDVLTRHKEALAQLTVSANDRQARVSAQEAELLKNRRAAAGLSARVKQETEALTRQRQALNLRKEELDAAVAQIAQQRQALAQRQKAREEALGRITVAAHTAEAIRKAQEAAAAQAEQARRSVPTPPAEPPEMPEPPQTPETVPSEALSRQETPQTARPEAKAKVKKGSALMGVLVAVLAMALVVGLIFFGGGRHAQYWEKLYEWPDTGVQQSDVPEDSASQEDETAAEDDLPPITIGDTVTFGHYEQDNDTSNGPEPIQWKVLDVQDGKALIISEKILARGAHRNWRIQGHGYVTWETSLIRSWMNDDFYDVAFTDVEKKAIQLTDVKDEANPYTADADTRLKGIRGIVGKMEPGADTQDYVFSLSLSEFEKYFSDPESAKAEMTDVAKVGNPYAKDDKIRTSCYGDFRDPAETANFSDWLTPDGVMWSWWLRTVSLKDISPGNTMVYVSGNGMLDPSTDELGYASGMSSAFGDFGIRPAMWVDASVLVAALNPGDTYTFGHYEQDYDTSNGPEPIQWKVLDVQDGKALLLSRDVLIRLQYHPQETGAAWKDCTLRQWLNDDFYHAAFSGEELKRVCLTRNVNEDNPTCGTAGGEDTDDHVFLLSLSEAEKYFSSDEARQCEFSAAVNMIVDQEPGIQKDVIPTDDPYGYGRRWWLRTPGMYPLATVIIEKDGSVSRNGNTGAYASGVACHQWNGVRPAIWITLASGGAS